MHERWLVRRVFPGNQFAMTPTNMPWRRWAIRLSLYALCVKTGIWLQGGTKLLMICLAILTQPIRVTNMQTEQPQNTSQLYNTVWFKALACWLTLHSIQHVNVENSVSLTSWIRDHERWTQAGFVQLEFSTLWLKMAAVDDNQWEYLAIDWSFSVFWLFNHTRLPLLNLLIEMSVIWSNVNTNNDDVMMTKSTISEKTFVPCCVVVNSWSPVHQLNGMQYKPHFICINRHNGTQTLTRGMRFSDSSDKWKLVISKAVNRHCRADWTDGVHCTSGHDWRTWCCRWHWDSTRTANTVQGHARCTTGKLLRHRKGETLKSHYYKPLNSISQYQQTIQILLKFNTVENGLYFWSRILKGMTQNNNTFFSVFCWSTVIPRKVCNKLLPTQTWQQLLRRCAVGSIKLKFYKTNFIQVAQLLQRDSAAGWVSYGQKWKISHLLTSKSISVQCQSMHSLFVSLICFICSLKIQNQLFLH